MVRRGLEPPEYSRISLNQVALSAVFKDKLSKAPRHGVNRMEGSTAGVRGGTGWVESGIYGSLERRRIGAETTDSSHSSEGCHFTYLLCPSR